MALSVFDDRESPPTDRALGQALGSAAKVWDRLKEALVRECGGLDEEWGFAGVKYGWSLRLKRGSRVVLYLTPGAGSFLASLALGEKASAAARAARLPQRLLALIEAAPRYAEGRGVRVPVRTARDASGIPKLVALKLGLDRPARARAGR
jgi:hypothetical protein